MVLMYKRYNWVRVLLCE
uniref:Uncharacterized protein n=1 Tax=Anguilla anguilla TaxID=7936 RepID=A0A0E9U8V9_ANGAN